LFCGLTRAAWQGWSKKLKAMQDTIKAKRELIEPKPLGKQGYGRPFRQTALTVWHDASRLTQFIASHPIYRVSHNLSRLKRASQPTKNAATQHRGIIF